MSLPAAKVPIYFDSAKRSSREFGKDTRTSNLDQEAEMFEKRSVDDVFQEAFEDFFAKKKTTNEEGAPEGPARDQDEPHPGERK
jgi:hypothetical protein